jgi:hypothetical protein
MSCLITDLVGVKAIVARWVEDLRLFGDPLPAPEVRELLRQLSLAPLSLDCEGNAFLEIPGLSTLGIGIFRHSFHAPDGVVYIAPYAPVGSLPVPREALQKRGS